MTSFFNYGSAGAIQAQVIQSLDSIPKSEFFELRKDPDQFNLWQKTILNDDIKDFLNHNVYQRSEIIGATEGFTRFEFNLMGMTDVRRMYAEFEFVTDITQYDSTEIIYQFAMGFLQCMNRVNIKLGQQLHDINKEQTNNANFMYAYLNDTLFSDVEKDIILTSIGNISPRTFLTADDADILNYAPDDIVNKIHYGAGFKQNATIVINIPIFLMHPFFIQKKTFLPTDLKMEMEFFYKQKFSLLKGIKKNRSYLEVKSAKINKIVYQTIIPKPDILALLNNKWFTNKLMYNIMRYEYKEYFIPGDTMPATLNKTICFDYRPLSLILVPYKTLNTKDNDSYPYVLPKCDVSDSFMPLCLNYTKIKVSQNGQELYHYSNNFPRTNKNFISNSYDIFEKLNSEYRLVGNEISKFDNHNDISVFHKHAPFVITLDPSGYYTKNVFSSRTEKANIDLELNFNYPDDSNIQYTEPFNFRIYYTYIRQMTISPEKNVMEIDWPVISSSSAQTYIQNTFNTN